MHLRNSKYPLHLSLFFFSKNKIFSLKTLIFSFFFFFVKKARAKQSVSPTHFCSQRGNFHSQVLKSRDQKIKWNGQGDLKSSCHIFSPGVFLICLLSKKDFVKQNIALRAQFRMLILACFTQITN